MPEPAMSIRAIRITLQKIDRALCVIEKQIKIYKDREWMATREEILRRKHELEPILVRSPWSHPSSALTDEEHKIVSEWRKELSKDAHDIGHTAHWVADARRRIRSTERELRHFDTAKPVLPHLKIRRAKRQK